MRDGERNKGSLQFILGEILTAWGIGNLQATGDSAINDKAVFTLEAVLQPKIRKDTGFQSDFMALDARNPTELRYKQLGLLIWKASEAGLLLDKALPEYGVGDEDA